jgi:hypothetical protein
MFNIFSWVEISHQSNENNAQCCMHTVVVAVGPGDDSHKFCSKMTPMLVKKMNV